MTTSAYLSGRKRYQRPQAVLWSENAGTLTGGLYVPNGYEVGANTAETDPDLLNQFIILSDHNRSELSFTPQRIEQRQRTINGRMRSYHIADKLQIQFSWNRLPSRAYYQVAAFNETTGISPYKNNTQEFTADGGAGGVAILDWYNNHTGPFWMYLAYDNYANFKEDGEVVNNSFGHLAQYNEIIQVYFADFNYSVVKRGGNNFDMWDISVTLEEV
ncbi:hypothetical protein EB001_05280 [bacterium]|jgi:hypothetical protein|nr:hypothetical protein [bacterium]